jgi:hypothetical protein
LKLYIDISIRIDREDEYVGFMSWVVQSLEMKSYLWKLELKAKTVVADDDASKGECILFIMGNLEIPLGDFNSDENFIDHRLGLFAQDQVCDSY